MVQPERAIVKPRYMSSGTGESLPLEDEILALIAKGRHGIIHLIGPVGSGKTTALQHLASIIPAEANVRLVDEFDEYEKTESETHLVIRAVKGGVEMNRARGYRLASWGVDDLIEYMLATHPAECNSVLSRISSADRRFLRGNAELCYIIVEQLAANPAVPSARAALNRFLQVGLGETADSQALNDSILAALLSGNARLDFPAELSLGVAQILRHQQVQVLLASTRIAADLRTGAKCEYLQKRLPRDAVIAVAEEVDGCDAAKQHLKKIISRGDAAQSMAVNILHLADAKWVPPPATVKILAGAYLDHARWPQVNLSTAFLYDCDFAHADLAYADLSTVHVERTCFANTRLSRANLNSIQARDVDFSNADLASITARLSRWHQCDLTAAKLTNASLVGAVFDHCKCVEADFAGADLAAATFKVVDLSDSDLSYTNLTGATLSHLKLRGVNLKGACLVRAKLINADLEDQDLPNIDFQAAKMDGVLLTGSVLSRANFRHASLRNAGLGDVDMAGACLANANLLGASFHMGSSRSGLLFTPIASEGTRTGFYTDDADEQNFKAPEEIRKANLCGADLRGARIDNVDFYLVDLRGALYDSNQEQHFRRCRAILENKVV